MYKFEILQNKLQYTQQLALYHFCLILWKVPTCKFTLGETQETWKCKKKKKRKKSQSSRWSFHHIHCSITSVDFHLSSSWNKWSKIKLKTAHHRKHQLSTKQTWNIYHLIPREWVICRCSDHERLWRHLNHLLEDDQLSPFWVWNIMRTSASPPWRK